MFDPTATGRPGPGRRPRPLLRTMVGDVLRRTRLAQHRTLADVARAARISMPYLSELERGRKEGSSEILAAICDALRLDLADLLAGVESELASDRVRRARVIPLDTARDRRGRRGSEELAADWPGQAPADWPGRAPADWPGQAPAEWPGQAQSEGAETDPGDARPATAAPHVPAADQPIRQRQTSQLLTREPDAGQARTGEQPQDIQPAVPAGEQPSSEWLIVRIGPGEGLPGGLGAPGQRSGGFRPGDVVCKLAA